MSGRKSGEVAAVLRQGESVRRMTDGIYSREIENCRQNYLACLEDERKIKSEIASLTVNLDGTAREMFGNDGTARLNEFNGLKNSAEKINLSDKSQGVISKLQQIDSELKAADREADDIRESIKTKYHGWYCDEEYSRAQDLVVRYSELRDRRVAVEREMKNLLTAERQKRSSLQSSASQAKNISAQIANMNAVAAKRKEANGFRDELRKALSGVNSIDAQKFFAAEFETLKKNVSDTVSLNDDGVLAKFQNVYEKVTDFQKRLIERVALWQKQKKDAEELFAQMEHVAAEKLVGPVDYYNDGENGKKVGMFEYLKTYGGKDLASEYMSKRNNAENLINQENFLDAMDVMRSAIDFAESARKDALQLQESMLKKTELAGAIQDVMYELRYDTDLEIINDNPNDGFKITCKAGDEIIDFTNVNIDDDGKVKVEIDHKEGSGKCAASWQSIAQRLNEVGIPLGGVTTANGKNVLLTQTPTTTSIPSGEQMRG